MIFFIYAEELPFLIFLESFLSVLLAKYLPNISKHFKIIELPNSFWITKIILSLFLYSFKLSDGLRFWDYLLATDIFSILSVTLALLEINE